MKDTLNGGCVDIWLDEIVPCLKDIKTGEIKETVVFKIESRSFLRKFKEKDGWGINWINVPTEVEVYALALKVYGFALNKELLNHYIEVIGASFLGILHPFHFMLDKGAAQKLLEVYTYEWN